MTDLEEAFARRLMELAPAPGVGLVAVSGGPDSLALLHLLIRRREAHQFRLVVAHVDHGIHPESATVADAVSEMAHHLGLPVERQSLRLGRAASETRARGARYRWLFATLKRLGPGRVITAHHRDDQVETVLLRVLGGSGPAGLAGMSESGPRLLRPLLRFSREEVRAYASGLGLAVWEDPANQESIHLRSWLRTEILPRLGSRIPDLDRRILSLAHQAGADREAWDHLLEVLPLDYRRDDAGVSVASGLLRSYDSSLCRALIMALSRQTGHPLGPVRAGRVVSLLRRGRSGTRVELGQGWCAAADFGRLTMTRDVTAEGWGPLLVVIAPGVGGSAAWRWSTRREAAPREQARDAWHCWLIPGGYEVRSWQPGDRIQPIGGTGRRLVVRCMQDRKVASRERPGWPVVLWEGAIVWVPGVTRSGDRIPKEGTEALRIDVERA